MTMLMGFFAASAAASILGTVNASREHGARWLFVVLGAAVLGMGIAGLWGSKPFHPTGPYLGLTGLRAWFLVVLGLVAVVVGWYRRGYHTSRPRAMAAWLPLFLASMVLVVVANNLWVFIGGWELMALASFFLVILYPERPGVVRAGYVYLVMSQVSSAAVLAGLLLVSTQLGTDSFSAWAISAHTMPLAVKSWVFGLLGLGFAVKSGLVPLHVWLPRAHPAAPVPVSGLMSGAMIKLGVFGVIQFLLFYLGPMPLVWAASLLAAGAVSSLLGVLYALMEHNLKRLLAYHSIENVGIIFLGVGVAALGEGIDRPVLVTIGLAAALFHTLNHALFKSQLFLAAGAVEQHSGTLDANALGGLVRSVPGTAAAFLLGSMAITGLPPFNGFVSEYLTLQGLLSLMHGLGAAWAVVGLGLAVVLAATGGLAALCFVKASGVIFLGEPRRVVARDPIPGSMVWPPLVSAALCLWLGVDPEAALDAFGFLGRSAHGLLVDWTGVLDLPLMAAVLGGLSLLLWWASRGQHRTVVPRWATGRDAGAHMQLSSPSFAKAVRTTFAVLYRPHRQLIRVGDEARDFPTGLVYEGGTESVWDRYGYEPLYGLWWTVARTVSRLHAGPVRLYLAYLLGTVGLMLLLLH